MDSTLHRNSHCALASIRCALAVVLGIVPLPARGGQVPNEQVRLADLTLEELMRIEVRSASGLTGTDLRRAPASLTEIDAAMVRTSGARDINHLLEIYIPNVQMIDHHHLQAHLGFRGIISDREDKYLFQVNGRTMNNRMFVGADNERAIPLLGDIRQVSVVRGPASSTHGAGALAGVIDLTSYTGLTFEGFDVRVRQGVGDRYTATEVRAGRRFDADSGVFAYVGVADQSGSDSDYFIGRSYPARNGLAANVAGQPLQAPMARYGEQGFGQIRQKVHVSYIRGPLEVWGRYVQDGNESRPLREIYTTPRPDSVPLETWVRGREFVNRQATATAQYTRQFTPQWKLSVTESVDRWGAEEQRMGTQVTALTRRTAVEKEFFSRAIVTWSPVPAHSLAVGSEHSREWFFDPFVSDALDRVPVVTQRRWTTDTVSFLAEHQWRINPRWTSFVSARTDSHTYTDTLISPRAALIFTPNERDTWRFTASRSVRRSIDSELWAQYARLGTIPRPEALRSYELNYRRSVGAGAVVASNVFYEDYDATGWVPALYLATSLGRFHLAGGEVRATLTRGGTRLVLSQALTKLLESSVPAGSPAAGQAISAQPYGFGSDLANWARFIGKAALEHDLAGRLTLSTSVIHYSGFKGARDYAAYAETFAQPPSAIPISDPGFDTPYGANLYWNAGVEFRPLARWSLRLDGYNLVAPFDRTLSKRNFYFRLSEFNVQPASLAMSVGYRF